MNKKLILKLSLNTILLTMSSATIIITLGFDIAAITVFHVIMKNKINPKCMLSVILNMSSKVN